MLKTPKTQYYRIDIKNPSPNRGDYVTIAYQVYSQQFLNLKQSYPLILLHGWTCVKEDWFDFAIKLSSQRTIIAIDNRGIGQSKVYFKQNNNNNCKLLNDKFDVSIEDMAYDSYQLIKYIIKKYNYRFNKVDLLGYSMGSRISQFILIKYPSIIRKTILLSTAPGGANYIPYPNYQRPQLRILQDLIAEETDPDKKLERTYDLYRFLHRKGFNDLNVFKQLMHSSVKYNKPQNIIDGQGIAIENHNCTKLLHKINGKNNPVLVIHGDYDRLTNWKNAEWVSKQIKYSKFILLEDEGHRLYGSYIGKIIVWNYINTFLSNDFNYQIKSKCKL